MSTTCEAAVTALPNVVGRDVIRVLRPVSQADAAERCLNALQQATDVLQQLHTDRAQKLPL